MQKTNFPTLHSIADTALKNGQYLLNAVSAPVCSDELNLRAACFRRMVTLRLSKC